MKKTRLLIYGTLILATVIVASIITNPAFFASLLPIKQKEYTKPPEKHVVMDGILVFDLDGDGIELSALKRDTQTFFDLDEDGFAEQISWVNKDDGILVFDQDEDGSIKTASELFGSTKRDGFELLAKLDTNSDSVIDAYDDQWSSLRIWQDLNQDGRSQKQELQPLSNWGITKIEIFPKSVDIKISGNTLRKISNYHRVSDAAKGKQISSNYKFGTVSLTINQTNSSYAKDYKLDIRALFLPSLRGFGELPDLHVAISQDEELFSAVQALAFYNNSPQAFGSIQPFDASVKNLLFHWAGVQNVDPNSRGANINAKELMFLEKFLGQKFVQNNGSSDPFPNAAKKLKEAWHNAFENLRAHLIIQLWGNVLFPNAKYNVYKGDIDGPLKLSEAGITELTKHAKDAENGPTAFWKEVARFIKSTKKIENLTPEETALLSQAVTSSGSKKEWGDIVLSLNN